MIELRVSGREAEDVVDGVKRIAEKFRGDHVLLLRIETAGGERTLTLGPRWRCSRAPVVLSMLGEFGTVTVRERSGPPC